MCLTAIDLYSFISCHHREMVFQELPGAGAFDVRTRFHTIDFGRLCIRVLFLTSSDLHSFINWNYSRTLFQVV
jgi:hypothetical protein